MSSKRFAMMLLLLLGLTRCATVPGLPLQPKVDLSRYSGRWYIIANIPYFAENGKVGSYFDISLHKNRIYDDYVGYPAKFTAKPFRFRMVARVVPGFGNAYWRESPIWPLTFAYLILYVDADYQTALVGYPGLKYGWVLARVPVLPPATYQALLSRLATIGYDTSKFRIVQQNPLKEQ
ncbi:MAG: lipocalin family protein [Acidocella sp.]|nr:lipocalin family protein [Acidocella sp.]